MITTNIASIRWSPDGRFISFLGNVSGEHGVHILPRLSGQKRTYRFDGRNAGHAWSPDGEQIVLASNGLSHAIVFNVATMDEHLVPYNEESYFTFGVDWSPVGNRWAFIMASEDYSEWYLRTMNPDGSEKTIVLEDSMWMLNPRWSNDGQSVYYVQEGRTQHITTHNKLWNVQLSSSGKALSNPQLILDDIDKSHQISFSGDGNKLLLYTNQFYHNIFIGRFGGKQAQSPSSLLKLTQLTSNIQFPRLSPKGDQIAFLMQNVSGNDLYTISVEGGGLRQRTFSFGYGHGLAWDNTGQQIVHGGWDDAIHTLWLTNLETEKTRKVADTEFSQSGQLAWSHGDSILFHYPGNQKYGVVHSESGEERSLLPDNEVIGWKFSPAVSPNGAYIAFFWNRVGPQSGLWLVSLEDDRHLPIVYSQSGIMLYPIKWSSDGAWIYASTSREKTAKIVRVAVDGSVIEDVATVPGMEWWNVDISPDDSMFVVALPEQKSNIWMVQNFDPN